MCSLFTVHSGPKNKIWFITFSGFVTVTVCYRIELKTFGSFKDLVCCAFVTVYATSCSHSFILGSSSTEIATFLFEHNLMSFHVCVNFSWFAELGMDLCYAFVQHIENGHDNETIRHMFKAFFKLMALNYDIYLNVFAVTQPYGFWNQRKKESKSKKKIPSFQLLIAPTITYSFRERDCFSSEKNRKICEQHIWH